MADTLVIHVRFHDGRYHGEGDWPPCPARLFQALVAAGGIGGPLDSTVREALLWMERLPSPVVAAPYAWPGQRVMYYMPNNDMDAVGGDLRRISDPWTFDASIPFLYVWQEAVDAAGNAHAITICSLAGRLYQLGRGVDMAWAWGELLERSGVEELLASFVGRVVYPSEGGGGKTLLSPDEGSLITVENRYRAYGRRFETEGTGKTVQLTFQKPPRPSFRAVSYDSPPSRQVYELRAPSSEAPFAAWPLVEVCTLVVSLRDGAVARLEKALPARQAEIQRVLVGRKPDGANDGPSTERARIIPMPSIGHPHADRAIRRVLVETPADCPLRVVDVNWAFSALELAEQEGSVQPIVLTPAADDGMLHHYGIGAESRIWRTVTPAALPEAASRRRIDPVRQTAEAKAGAERRQEHQHAAAAVMQALRHAAVRARVETIRVQREPFEGNGERVEAFAPGARFPKERLWQVEITFAEPVSGPLVIGDGRFLGLGVMTHVPTVCGIHMFSVETGLAENSEAREVAQALRRAVMSMVRGTLGNAQPLRAFFSGHERDGRPAQSDHPHLAFAFDPRQRRLLVVAPHVLDRRDATYEERQELKIMDQALRGFHELRAGAAGLLKLREATVNQDADALVAARRTWESVTDYHVTRHAKRVSAHEALAMDLRTECRRRGLPDPHVTVLDCHGASGVGLSGRVRLAFKIAVSGPLLLGRGRHTGSGLFEGKAQLAGAVE